jgi:hypothetical protein
VFVIRFFQLAADLHIDQLAAVFFIKFYRHCQSVWLLFPWD